MPLFFVFVLIPVGILGHWLVTCGIAWYLLSQGRKAKNWNGIGSMLRLSLSPGIYDRKQSMTAFHEIFWWWELRRLHFNLSLTLAGLCSSTFYWLFEYFYFKLPENPLPLLGTYIPLSLLFGALANVAFSAGWVVETLLTRVSAREQNAIGAFFFKAGTLFSVILTISIPVGLIILRLIIN